VVSFLRNGVVRLFFKPPQVAAPVKRAKLAGYLVKSPPKKMPASLDYPDGHEISLYWADSMLSTRPR